MPARGVNEHPLHCPGCSQHFPIGTTSIGKRNDEWLCGPCYGTPTRVTVLPTQQIDRCAQCGGRLDDHNRTINVHGQVVHGGKGITCPTKRAYTRTGAETVRRDRQRRRQRRT